MGVFDGIEMAQPSKSGQWFLPGHYKVELTEIKLFKSQLDGTNYVAIEGKVLESDNEAIKVGMTRSQLIDMDKPTGQPNMKYFVCAVSGVDPFDPEANEKVCKIWSEALDHQCNFEKVCSTIVDTGQPLKGTVMELDCVQVNTQKGGEFTKHNWVPRTE